MEENCTGSQGPQQPVVLEKKKDLFLLISSVD